MAFLDEVVARLNEQFAGEDSRSDLERPGVEGLVAAMKTDADLVEQAQANSEAQFLASPSLTDAITLAVIDTDDAHSRMTELFHNKGSVEKAVIELLGRVVYLDVASSVRRSERGGP